jgi:hypothetical protein
VVAITRALLKQRRLPAKYCGEAVMMAIHLLNRLSTRSLQGKTPYEDWHGRTLAVSSLKTFGCVAYTKDLGQLRKLDDHGKPGIFIGYAEGAKPYRILDPVTHRVKVSRDVVFDEGRSWDWSSPNAGSSASVASDFTIEYWELGGAGGAQGASPAAPRSPSPNLGDAQTELGGVRTGLGGGQTSSEELGSICRSTSDPTELINAATSCSDRARRSSDGARRWSEELRRAQTDLGSIWHSTTNPTELINAATSVSYCPHRFGYLTDGFSQAR